MIQCYAQKEEPDYFCTRFKPVLTAKVQKVGKKKKSLVNITGCDFSRFTRFTCHRVETPACHNCSLWRKNITLWLKKKTQNEKKAIAAFSIVLKLRKYAVKLALLELSPSKHICRVPDRFSKWLRCLTGPIGVHGKRKPAEVLDK